MSKNNENETEEHAHDDCPACLARELQEREQLEFAMCAALEAERYAGLVVQVLEKRDGESPKGFSVEQVREHAAAHRDLAEAALRVLALASRALIDPDYDDAEEVGASADTKVYS